MARFKNANWNLPTADKDRSTAKDWPTVRLAVLMDIRDELQTLNRVFACHNAQAIPGLLREIRGYAVRSAAAAEAIKKNTAKKRKKRVVTK